MIAVDLGPSRMPHDQLAEKENQRKRSREKFRRRRINLLKKANALSSLCEADVYVVIHRYGRLYTYKSRDSPNWPPSEDDIVS